LKIRNIILLYLAAILVLVASAYNISKVAKQMSDENIYANQERGVIFIDIGAGGVSEVAGIQVGDRLVMIDGDTIRSAMHAQSYLDVAESGESLIYTIERGGQVFDVKVNLALAGLRVFHVGALIAGLLFFAFGLFIGNLKPEIGYARLLALTSFSLALLFINVQVLRNVQSQPEIYRFTLLLFLINGYFFTPVLAHALLYFPERKFEYIPRVWLIYSPYAVAGATLIYALYQLFTRSAFDQGLYLIPFIYTIIMHLIFFKRKRVDYKKRSRPIRFSAIFLVSTWLISALFLATRFAWAEYLAFLSAILPIAFFYTTIRYRVYDIYVRIRLSLVYSAIQILLLVVFIGSIAIIIRTLPSWNIDLPAIFLTGSSIEFRNTGQMSPEMQADIQKGYLLIIGIAAAFVLFAFKNRLQKWIDRLFFQQKYDYRQAMRNFGELVSSVFSRATIGETSVAQIQDIMKLKGILIALSQNGAYAAAGSRGTLAKSEIPSLTLPENLHQKFITTKKPIRQEELHSITGIDEEMGKIYCATPVISGSNRLEAILFTGEKLSESPYNNDDLEMLTYFADHLGSAFERARLYEEMTEKERLQRELEIAREIQLNSLPAIVPDYKGIQIHASLTAAYEVGGDYYDYLHLSKTELGIIVGDVVGKGTSAALHMSKIQGFLQGLKLQNLSAETKLERLNELIRTHFEPNFFFTALYGIFDTEKRMCSFYRLGHNGLIYFNSTTKKISSIEPDGLGFGLADSDEFSENLKVEKIQYHTGDIFVFLTDGYMEAMNAEQKPLGDQILYDTILRESGGSAEEVMEALVQLVKEYSGAHQHDDATGVVVKITD
jgi:serine phosphatase RsbU (regulator of sigma subunit)